MQILKVAIFCFYDKNGHVGEDVIYLLEELKKNVDFLIIVVNGKINNKNILLNISNDVLIRNNEGWDAGAYREAILNKKYFKIIKKCKELILCNSSFFGPLIPLSHIFYKMKKSEADFWGISSYERGIMRHLQSYFLVFKEHIIQEGKLFEYFQKYIQKDTLDYFEICASFENGLFEYLVDIGYVYDAYVRNISCDNYRNSYGSLMIDGLPIVKKKIFSDEFFVKKNVLDTLKFILNNFSYDICLIIDAVRYLYDVLIEKKEVETHTIGIAKIDWIEDVRENKINEIREFIKKNDNIYIYGAGSAGKSIYMAFFTNVNKAKFKGFIVSKNQKIIENKLFGYPVSFWNEVKKIEDKSIIVGMSKKNCMWVESVLGKRENVIYLWDNI